MFLAQFRLAPLMALIVLASGCAFSAVRRPDPDLYSSGFSREQRISISSAGALAAAKSTLEAMGYEIQSVTPELGQIRTKAVQVAIPQLCDCGTWNRDSVRGTADSILTVRVTAGGTGNSTVTIEHVCGTNFSGQNLYGATTRRETYQCASRGMVEKNFWSTFDQIVKARAAS
jgi:hypothetical protein